MKQRTSSRRRRGQIIQNQHKLLATLALTFVLLWVGAIAQQALQLWEQQQRLDHYGSWQAALYDTNPGLNGELLQHQNLDAVGQMTDCGEIVNSAGLTLARVGSLDDTAKQLSRLAFVAGNYPRADDEIALEMSVLAGLGYSFDVGQQIALPITFTDSQGQQETQTYQFTLCGVLRSFSAGWNAADAGPVSGIVSQGFVDAAPGVRSYVELVHGNYARVQDASELSALLSPDGAFVLNSNAYPGWRWDLESLMENGLLVILAVILGLFLVACSIVTWLWGNRQRLQICSDVGATRRQLRRSLSKRYVRAARQAFAWISLPAAVLVLAGFAALCLAGIEITLFTLLPALALPAILCGVLALAGGRFAALQPHRRCLGKGGAGRRPPRQGGPAPSGNQPGRAGPAQTADGGAWHGHCLLRVRLCAGAGERQRRGLGERPGHRLAIQLYLGGFGPRQRI